MIDAKTPEAPWGQAAQAVSSAKRILAVTHVNPDGDALGSLAAFGHIVRAIGGDVRLFCESAVPDHFSWLPLPAPVVDSLAALGDWRPDLVVLLDCAEANRAGKEIAALLENSGDAGPATLNIDHHASNPLFAAVNWVDPGMCATGAMTALLAKTLGVPLSGGLGQAVYLALVSDTGSFSYSNTNALALQLAAEIVGNGLSLAEFTAKYENNWTISRMHLWGDLMRAVQIFCDGKIVVSVVTDELLKKYNAPRSDLEGYASWLRRLASAKVVILSRPSSKGGSKISLRSMGDVDVQKIAAELGGGGHKGAAGADRADSPRDAAQAALKAACRAICPAGCGECALSPSAP